MKVKYEYKSDWNLSNPIRVDKTGTEIHAYKTNYNVIFKQKLKQEQIKQKIAELDGADFAKALTIHKSFKIKLYYILQRRYQKYNLILLWIFLLERILIILQILDLPNKLAFIIFACLYDFITVLQLLNQLVEFFHNTFLLKKNTSFFSSIQNYFICYQIKS
ncbi:unnamed protein product [Paramecium sonneborni]|uniref:Uncharacterized protein n=1 Tax=Paramecium sonneborni TaxID=65129 RepID=A0A8S1MD89_9CILI|nr:unnamed protein product [Paramecium sonneborni]